MSRYCDWAIDQRLLLPPSVREFVAPAPVCLLVQKLAAEVLDVSAIERTYSSDPCGNPPYHPRMLVALLLHAYTQGIYSSRRIAKACEERVDFMALTAMQQPDFRTISDLRKRHLAALSGLSELFVQVLAQCREAGIVKLGHVALDGTKVQANASKRKAQSNFTAPDREIMKSGPTYEQSYNAQAAVDAESQVIVAQSLGNQQNDHHELLPLVDQVEQNVGALPAEISADSNYCSEENLEGLEERGVGGYVATGQKKHGTPSPTSGDTKGNGPLTKGNGPLTKRMRTRLRRGGYRSRYRLREQVVEPVFGQIKECRGLRRFLLRGLDQVRAEWALLCTAHNLLKLAAARA